MKRYWYALSTAIGVLALAGAVVSAQAPAQGQGGRAGGGRAGGAPQQPHQNTQILDRMMPTPQLIQIMQQFTQALGVTCNHCHVFNGPGNPMNDFVTDAKQPKKTARTMMLMTRELNAKLGAELGKPAADVTQVQCVTCHRGVAIPRQLADIVASTTMAKGAAAAVAEYRDLRRQYYGSQAYDFREDSLLLAAQRATQDNRPDDALALLTLNMEFFPMGARSYQAQSVAYQRKNDRENAIKALQRAIELDPNNAGYKNQLTQLQMPPAAN
jgi:hypothetical protein